MAGLDPVGIPLTLNILFPNQKSDVQQVFLSVFSEDSWKGYRSLFFVVYPSCTACSECLSCLWPPPVKHQSIYYPK